MLSYSQRKSFARQGAAALDRRVDEAVAAVAAEQAAERAVRAARANVESEPFGFTAADLAGVTLVRTAYGWRKVVRVSAKSVSVETGYSWTDRIELGKILGAVCAVRS